MENGILTQKMQFDQIKKRKMGTVPVFFFVRKPSQFIASFTLFFWSRKKGIMCAFRVHKRLFLAENTSFL